ncbi:hypothetical protein L6452_09492 [Arctium lappa]|uniref:Uncharacterized protein n=1 Tax=Arctium lappa TaxID=4217 RepID=A0ACB9DK76_ARCLA|nr:hypothetical protein L6452_09492 [Arctium lappa]
MGDGGEGGGECDNDKNKHKKSSDDQDTKKAFRNKQELETDKEINLAGTQSEIPEIRQLDEGTKVINAEDDLSNSKKIDLIIEKTQPTKNKEERDGSMQSDEVRIVEKLVDHNKVGMGPSYGPEKACGPKQTNKERKKKCGQEDDLSVQRRQSNATIKMQNLNTGVRNCESDSNDRLRQREIAANSGSKLRSKIFSRSRCNSSRDRVEKAMKEEVYNVNFGGCPICMVIAIKSRRVFVLLQSVAAGLLVFICSVQVAVYT